MEVNVHHAKTHLSRLIAAAEAGEEVIIARNGKPAVRLVLAVTEAPAAPAPAKLPDRVPGRLAGKIILPPNWEKEWEEFDNEIADLMINGPISNDFLPAEWPAEEDER